MPRQKTEFQPLARSFDLSRANINEDARTVDLVFSTETDKVERWFGVEILDHSKGAVRMERLSNAAPLLMDHDSRDQVGVIESAAIDGKVGKATVRFSKSARGEEIFQDVKDGIRSKVSVGYRVHDLKLERSDKQTGVDTYRITDWEPFEVSIVSIPADDQAGIRDGSSIFGQRAAELSTLIDMSKPKDNNTEDRADDQASAATVPAENPAIESRAADVDKELEALKITKLAEERAGEIARAELANERNRSAEITEIGQTFKRSEVEIKEAIKAGTSVDDFKRSLLDKLKAENPAYSAGRVEVISEAPKRGTRSFLAQTWAESAKRALGSRGAQIHIP
ncbi:MAG: HK97 family phage prohead protease, partial [Candidatus Limnocylindrus sp.]